jgi:hypothetical protein
MPGPIHLKHEEPPEDDRWPYWNEDVPPKEPSSEIVKAAIQAVVIIVGFSMMILAAHFFVDFYFPGASGT